MEKQFKAGDKVKCVDAGENSRIATGKEYRVAAVYSASGKDPEYTDVTVITDDGATGVYYAYRFELVTEPEQEFVVTRVYPNGGFGVTHYFDTEQEAREHISTYGDASGSYKLSRVADSQMLKVQEETTVTRSVVPA